MIDLIDTLIDSLTGTAEAFVTILSCVPLLLASALYVLMGLTLTFLCRAARKGSVWMAWVPFANLYLLGLMADVYTDDRVLRGEIDARYAPSALRRKMLGYSIVQSVLGNIAGVAVLISLFSGFAGLLTGFGAVWGSGCTSGHGVCGLSRLSVRSLVATMTFMAAGMAMTMAPVSWSRLPVGSSASSSLGLVTMARASPTRCCSPPDSALGRWSSRSPRPTLASASVAAARIAL
jgi:uncharacterized membrane protein YedE/YeeE